MDPIADLALFKVKKQSASFSFFRDQYVQPITDEEVAVYKNISKNRSKLDLGNIKRVITIEGFGELSELEQDISEENDGCPVINGEGNLVGVASKSLNSEKNYSLNFQSLQKTNFEFINEKGERKLPGNKKSKFPPARDFIPIYIHILNDEFQEALILLEKEMSADLLENYTSNKKQLYFLKAFLEKKLDRTEDALKSYTQILEIDLNDANAYLERAKLKTQIGKFEEAGTDLEKSLKLGAADKVETRMAQADLLVKLRNYQAADRIYKELEFKVSNKKEFYKKRARVYLKLEMYQSAKDLLNKAIDLNPYDTDLYVMRGEANANLNLKDQAESDFNQGGVFEENNMARLKSIARSNLKMEDYEETMHALESAVKINPQDAEVLLLRGKAFNKIESYEDAKTNLDELIRKDPYLSEAYYQRGKSHMALSMMDESIKDFTKAVKLKPDYSGAYLDRGIAFGLIGDYNHALEDFEKVIELEPSNVKGHYDKALVLYKTKNLPGACKSWERAASLGDEASSKRIEEFCEVLKK